MAQHTQRQPAQVAPAGRRASAQLGPHALAAAALIALITTVAYLPSLNGGFILDDNLLLTDNRLIKADDGLYRFWFTTQSVDYWPVTNTTLWLEWRLWGLQPTGYHVTNLILHIVGACLIGVILLRLSVPGAFVAALLFAVHPVNVESVAWVAQRKGLVAMLFFLLSVLWYMKAESQSRPDPTVPSRWYWLSLAAFVCAMLSKGSVAFLPLVLLGIVCWSRRPTRRDLLGLAPFVVVSAVLTLINIWFQRHGTAAEVRSAGLIDRALGAAAALWFYLYKALLPVSLSFVYPQWHIQPDRLVWWLPLAAALVVTGWLWRRRHDWTRPLLFGWGFFCVALLPVLGFTDVGFMEHSLVADHYQHLALIGVVALLGAGWAAWQRRVPARFGSIPYVVAGAAVLAFAALTWQRSGLYANAMTLYQATLETNPDAWLAHNNLGFALLQSGRLQDAIPHFEHAARLKPDYADARINLGFALLHVSRPGDAQPHIEAALRLKPGSPEAHYDMGGVLAQTGRAQEAIGEYERALQLKPDFPEAHYDLAVALTAAQRVPEAIEHYRQALRLKPDYLEAYNNLGGVLFENGRSQEAIEQYERALALKPDFPPARSNLGRARLKAGQTQQAIEQFEQVVRLTPEAAAAHNDLGVALAEGGRLVEASEQFQEALRLDPEYREARDNLDETRAMQRVRE